MRRGPRLAAAITAAVLAAVLVPQTAFASTAPAVGGGDVSYYQGTTTLPDSTQLDFAIVGVNAGRPTDPNPSLADQLAWAAQSRGVGHAKVDVYVASANPGTAGTWWPSSDRTKAGTKVRSPYGSCTARKATQACAWVYGNSYGRDDVHTVPAGTAIGTWWIDVEQDNTWSSSTARNRAVVEGMVAGLQAGKQRVGIYALSGQFRDILGTVPASSSVTKLPAWVAGAKDEAAALQRCSGASLTAGRVTLVQWVDFANTVDHDVACGVLTQPKPTIGGTYRAGHRLTAKVRTWSPSGVHLTYRWTRDGHPIAKATHRTYTLKKADRHHRIGVTVTGVLTGYSTAVQRSATHRIPR
ncbi:hypothetical protein [Amnibacterium kyonggiense]|uniref:Uncharacterized protein n=1 Tax=Amnibacterium kyonggiense TaxID=595671 RepID=A0A4R7FL46_9MICO|nr:hypothetical protein [Amnibacterium kyonggiense]TDS77096.1 hypothetical protein CLV52_2036 [Amnibacterium kyonggiense]